MEVVIVKMVKNMRTAMCDRWKCRRLYLTRLAKISGEFVP